MALGVNGSNKIVKAPLALNAFFPSSLIRSHVLPIPGENSANSNATIAAANTDDTATYHLIFLCSKVIHVTTPMTNIIAIIHPNTNGLIYRLTKKGRIVYLRTIVCSQHLFSNIFCLYGFQPGYKQILFLNMPDPEPILQQFSH